MGCRGLYFNIFSIFQFPLKIPFSKTPIRPILGEKDLGGLYSTTFVRGLYGHFFYMNCHEIYIATT